MSAAEEVLFQKLSKLTPQQATIYSTMAKKTSTAILFVFFFGGMGAHYFYMGKTKAGIFSLLFFWTLIPSFLAILFLFKVKRVVNEHNTQLVNSIISNTLLTQNQQIA